MSKQQKPTLQDLISTPAVDSVDEFKAAIMTATDEQLNKLRGDLSAKKINLVPEERDVLQKAIESLEEQRKTDLALEFLDNRLIRLRDMFGVKSVPASSEKPGETAPVPPTTPATTAEAATFGKKIRDASVAASILFGPLIEMIRKIPFAESILGIDKTDKTAPAVEKIILTTLSSPGMIGIDTSGPILGLVFGNTQKMAQQALAALQNEPKQKTAAETARIAKLKETMPNIDQFVTASGGVALLKTETGKITLQTPEGFDSAEGVALNLLAKQMRRMGRVQRIERGGPEMPTDAHRINFSTNGTLKFSLKDGVSLQDFAAMENLPVNEIAAAQQESKFRFDDEKKKWIPETLPSASLPVPPLA